MKISVAHLLIFVSLLAGCGSSSRPTRSTAELLAERHAVDVDEQQDREKLMQRLVARAESEVAASTQPSISTQPSVATTQPTLDILVISGGGDWGAFGAGVLKGWGKLSGDEGRPQFDVVTGVSTGALIAPFAFVGDDESIDRVVQLYRNPKSDWTSSRGLFFFMPNNPSFYTLPGLERELKKELDHPMIERIVTESNTGRVLIVNTTNIDLGSMHAWDIAEEAKISLATKDDEHVREILLASAGIPAIFPAREIHDYLYVDGAITGNILYGGRAKESQSFPAVWQAKHPNSPPPRIRYWVIFNNQTRFPPQVTRERWPDIMSRATIMATQTSTLNSIRHLYAQAEIAKLKRNADFQVRVICVPEDWVPPNQNVFDKDVMNNLADLGEKMGADPSSWMTESP